MAANKPLAGFTLIEVLLAMGITTFVALLAYSGLSASITAAESQQLQAQQIVDIQLPLTVLERDIRNVVARPIRDEYDDRVEALVGGAFNDYLLVDFLDDPLEFLFVGLNSNTSPFFTKLYLSRFYLLKSCLRSFGTLSFTLEIPELFKMLGF